MLGEKSNNIFTNFWEHNFGKTFELWGNNAVANEANSLQWDAIFNWFGFFIILLAVFVFLLSRTKVIEKISKHLLLCSSIVWFLGVFIYIVGFYHSQVNGLSVVPRAIISSFKMFLASHDLARIPKYLLYDSSYMVAFSLLHFTAAFISFVFIFRMIGYKIKSSLRIIIHRYFFAKNKVVHLFWGINEASCLLAEDISVKKKTETIIFIDVDEDSEENSQKKVSLSHIMNSMTIKKSEIYRLDEVKALVDHCYYGPAGIKNSKREDIFRILQLRNIGAIVKKSKKSYFYFLSDDEAKNIAGALNLQQDDKLIAMTYNKPEIYVHARRDANNEIFDHYSQYDDNAKRMKIKIVDSAYLSVVALKQNDKALPVNCVKINKDTRVVESSFNAMIIGFGSTGLEAFKFLYEYSAFIDKDLKRIPFKCFAIDEKMNKIEGVVREKMPSIGEDELSLINTSVDSEEFWTKISSQINDLNYIVITLNNDEIGLSLAVNLFKYALRKRTDSENILKILLRCYNNNNEKRMIEVASNLNKSIDNTNIEIILFGKEKDLYRCDTILSDAILKQAKEFHKVYKNSDLDAYELWEKSFGKDEIKRLINDNDKPMSRYNAIFDINRRIAQNISNSMHCRTKMILMGFESDESSQSLETYYNHANSREPNTINYKCDEKDKQLLLNMAIVEHERWIASHKLMGYVDCSDDDCIQKRHKCLRPWNELNEEKQSYDCDVVDTTIKIEYRK